MKRPAKDKRKKKPKPQKKPKVPKSQAIRNVQEILEDLDGPRQPQPAKDQFADLSDVE